jgi:hypothetical protein
MLWRREKSLPLPGIKSYFIGLLACSLVTVQAELFQFLVLAVLRNRKYAYCTDWEANIQVELVSLQVFQF